MICVQFKKEINLLDHNFMLQFKGIIIDLQRFAGEYKFYGTIKNKDIVI